MPPRSVHILSLHQQDPALGWEARWTGVWDRWPQQTAQGPEQATGSKQVSRACAMAGSGPDLCHLPRLPSSGLAPQPASSPTCPPAPPHLASVTPDSPDPALGGVGHTPGPRRAGSSRLHRRAAGDLRLRDWPLTPPGRHRARPPAGGPILCQAQHRPRAFAQVTLLPQLFPDLHTAGSSQRSHLLTEALSTLHLTHLLAPSCHHL